jgi:hypothetical protein
MHNIDSASGWPASAEPRIVHESREEWSTRLDAARLRRSRGAVLADTGALVPAYVLAHEERTR